jgi:hypothetical protein
MQRLALANPTPSSLYAEPAVVTHSDPRQVLAVGEFTESSSSCGIIDRVTGGSMCGGRDPMGPRRFVVPADKTLYVPLEREPDYIDAAPDMLSRGRGAGMRGRVARSRVYSSALPPHTPDMAVDVGRHFTRTTAVSAGVDRKLGCAGDGAEISYCANGCKLPVQPVADTTVPHVAVRPVSDSNHITTAGVNPMAPVRDAPVVIRPGIAWAHVPLDARTARAVPICPVRYPLVYKGNY